MATAHPGDEPGQALAIVVAIVTVILLACSVVVTAVTSAGKAAHSNSDLQVTQTTAEAAANYFYAALENTPGWSPAIQPNQFPGSMFSGYSAGSWVEISGAGLTSCPSPQATCVSFADSLQQLPYSAPGGAATAPFAVALQVDVRANCRFAGAHGCAVSRLVERITPIQYLDYLDFTGSQLLDPALATQGSETYATWFSDCTNGGTGGTTTPLADSAVVAGANAAQCPIPAYVGPTAYAASDQISGPVGTNDSTIYVCGTADSAAGQPSFTVPPQATSATPTAEYPLPSLTSPAGCSGTAPAGTSVAATPLPTSTSNLAAIAAAQDTYSTSTTLVLNGTSSASSYTANGVTKPWPATGVIYVDGDVHVKGTVCEPVTVAAAGSVYIDGNLSYSCSAASTGLIADNAVVVQPTIGASNQITCWASPVDGQCMTVDAAVMALGDSDLPASSGTPLGGSFYLQGWNSYLPPDGTLSGTTDQCTGSVTVCALVFDGSVSEAFRGAFGQYKFTSTTTSVLETGITKQFSFDTTLVDRQPPYFLEPNSSTWQRAGATFSGALQN